MKKTCLTFVLIYLGAAAALSVAVFLGYPTPIGIQDGQMTVRQFRMNAALATGAIAAFPLTLAVFGLLGVAGIIKERGMVRNSLAGRPPEEGQRMAAVGMLRAEGPPLTAPLSRRECAIYHYEIRFRTPKSGDSIAYWGYGLAPCRIDTVAGSVQLLAYADLDIPKEEQGETGRANAVRHLEATASTAHEVDVLRGAGIRDFQQLLADDDGRIQGDFRLAAPGVSLEGSMLQEQVVKNGDEVCAFGYYSAARGGFVPRPGCPEIFPIRLLKGTQREVNRRLWKTAIGSSFAAVVCLALTAGALLLAWRIMAG